MFRSVLMGTAAGAVGTLALDIATYIDMVTRGRPSSEVPAKTAERIVAMAGGPTQPSAPTPKEREEQQQHMQNRFSGMGALMGYSAGLTVGTAYGVLRPLMRDAPLPLSALVLGVAAMAAGDLPPIAVGTTNLKEW